MVNHVQSDRKLHNEFTQFLASNTSQAEMNNNNDADIVAGAAEVGKLMIFATNKGLMSPNELSNFVVNIGSRGSDHNPRILKAVSMATEVMAR